MSLSLSHPHTLPQSLSLSLSIFLPLSPSVSPPFPAPLVEYLSGNPEQTEAVCSLFVDDGFLWTSTIDNCSDFCCPHTSWITLNKYVYLHTRTRTHSQSVPNMITTCGQITLVCWDVCDGTRHFLLCHQKWTSKQWSKIEKVATCWHVTSVQGFCCI